MAEPDSNSGQNPADETDPFSATGMFLRSFDSAAVKSEEKLDDPFAKPVAEAKPVTPSPVEAVQSGSAGPGEFTRAFQALEPKRPVTPVAPTMQAPVESAESMRPPPPPPPSAPPSAPDEFTRIFVKPSAVSEQPVRPVSSYPSSASSASSASSSPRLKGFSSPGVSDSASAEGSFTQIFGGVTSAASSAPPASPPPAPKVQTFAPPPPVQAAPVKEVSWEPEPRFGSDLKATDREASSPDVTGSSATGLLSKLSGTGSATSSATGSRPLNTSPDWGESRSSFPAFSSPPPAPYTPPSSEDSGSVTRLIRRLSEDVRVPTSPPVAPASAVSADAFSPAALPVAEPAPPSSSGPGEFTRMISGDSIRAALGGSASAAPSATPTPAPSAAPSFAVPAVTLPTPQMAIPAVPAPAPVAPAPAVHAPVVAAPSLQVPKVEPPKVAAPALTAPAAPKSKLQEMLPLLLVVNIFLLIVLIVVVIFALRSR